MLTLNNISCVKDGRTLFKNLGFTVGDCCTLIIRGKKKSGKSSLLKIIACLEKSHNGEILYANENVQGKHWQEYCEIIHYIGHKSAIKQELTVKENLEFWVRMRNSEGRVNAAMTFFDLMNLQDVRCCELPIEMQKKVVLAKLLACRSEIWLLDEPFNDLDADTRLKLASLINTRCEQGGSVIISTNEDIKLENSCEICLEDFIPT